LPPVVVAGLHTPDQREAALVHRFSQTARQLRLLKRRALPSRVGFRIQQSVFTRWQLPTH
jgi:hypothetical protein